ncbi:MAG: TldD/PmbA family protein [Bacteroidota bacterium]|nr:TldD/PmbA family protein [Bacteroidota bacterium]
MLSNEQKELAGWAMQYGLEKGCQAVRVTLYSGSDTEFEVRNRQLDRLQQSSENQLVFNAYVDERYGSFSTNRLDKEELTAFITNAVESVRFLAKDPDRKLPDLSLCYRGGHESLHLFDPAFEDVDPDTKLAIAKAAAEEILDKDPRILSVQSNWNDGSSFRYIVSSNGFEGQDSVSYFSLSVSVSVKGPGESKPESYWYDQSLTFDELVKKGIGQKALERTLNKIGQQKVASGNYPMLVDNLNGIRLLSPLLTALNGSSLQQKNSFLLDKLEQQVLSEKLTITDDPLVPHTFGARLFDNEGVATQRRAVFNKGVLKTYFIDTYYASKMQVQQTINSPSRLVFELGARSCEEMVAGLDRGILITGFNGGNCNSNSGDFSFGIEGFLIENGHLTQPVTEMNITGNMLTLWKNVAEVGNDPRLNNAYQVPSLLFGGVDFSGL